MNDSHAPPNQPPHIAMLHMITGRWLAQAVCCAAELGVADQMTDQARAVSDLALALGVHEDSLYRLLKSLSAFGVFAQPEPRCFALTPLGATLRSDSPHSMRGVARFFGHETFVRAWARLGHSVRHGKPAIDDVTGVTAFELISSEPEMPAIFNEAMRSFSRAEIEGIVSTYDFSGIGTLADVGGSYGHLLAAILGKYPEMRGVLFDLPHAEAGARKTLAEAGLTERVAIVAGDFFTTSPPPCDAVILKHVIHNWSDDASVKILESCARALRPGSRLLIAEMLEPAGSVPHLAKLLDLEMLAMTQGGRERDEAEFGRLLDAAGFGLERVVHMPALISIIEGVRR